MNVLRRKTLVRLLDGIEGKLVRLLNGIDGKLDALLEVIEEEQEAMDNIPESLQNTDKYMEAEEALAEEALAELIDAQESMAEYIENLRELFHIEF